MHNKKCSVRNFRFLSSAVLLFALMTHGLAVWTTNGPNGMVIRDVAVDPNDSMVVYVLGYPPDVIYKSTNGGNSFTSSNNGIIPGEALEVVTVHPFFSNILFTGEDNLYRSMNGGESWQIIGAGLIPGSPIYYDGLRDAIVDPNNSSTIYVAHHSLSGSPGNMQFDGGIYKSTNTGETFVEVTPTGPIIFKVATLAIDALNSNFVYAGLCGNGTACGGVWKTTDAGISWSGTTPASPEIDIYSVEADPNVAGQLFAASNMQGCWKSTDYGSSWNLVFDAPYYGGYADISIQGPNLSYGSAGNGLQRSTNAGSSWTQLSNGIPTNGTSSLGSNMVQENLLYAGGFPWMTLYKSTDNGNSFGQKNKGFPVLAMNSVSTANIPSTAVYSTSERGLFKTVDNGNTWLQTTLYPPFGEMEQDIPTVAVCPSNQNIALAARVVDPLYIFLCCSIHRTTNGGETFTQVKATSQLSDIVFDPNNTNTAYLALAPRGSLFSFNHCPYHFYVSNDTGAIWTSIPMTGLGLAWNQGPTALVVESPGVLYAGIINSGVYKSTDGGYHWFAANSGIEGRYVYSLSKCYLYGGGIVAGTDNGVYRTTNGGATWYQVGTLSCAINDVFSGIVETRFRKNSLVLCRPILWAATDQGVYEYINGAWQPRNDGLGSVIVKELALTKPLPFVFGLGNNQGQQAVPRVRYSVLHAATPMGVYDYTFVESVPGAAGPQGEELEGIGNIDLQIFPNPIRTTGNIEIMFTITQASQVEIKIYDVSGRVHSIVTSDAFPAGNHNLKLDKDLASGMYFCMLRTDCGANTIRKFTVVR